MKPIKVFINFFHWRSNIFTIIKGETLKAICIFIAFSSLNFRFIVNVLYLLSS